MTASRLKRALVIPSALLSFGVMCLWSYTSTIDNFRVGVWSDWNLNLNVHRGRMEWTRAYAFAAPVPYAEWSRWPPPPRRIDPNPTTILGFWYSSGHQTGYMGPERDGLVRPADYWLLIIPLWFVLGVVSAPWVLWLWRWYGRSRRGRTGFEVRAAAQEPSA